MLPERLAALAAPAVAAGYGVGALCAVPEEEEHALVAEDLLLDGLRVRGRGVRRLGANGRGGAAAGEGEGEGVRGDVVGEGEWGGGAPCAGALEGVGGADGAIGVGVL